MLIDHIIADASGTKKVRVTEEFSQLLIVPDDTNLGEIKVSVYLERKGKNVEIINRLSLYKIKHLSANIEKTKILTDTAPFILSLFENGNFKSTETDAVIIEFTNMALDKELKLYGLQDFEQCSAIYKYEPKSILVGDRNKSFSLEGVERVLLPFDGAFQPNQVSIYSEIGFIYRDEKGGLVERKMLAEEILFSAFNQKDSNPYDSAQYNESDLVCLVVDGLEEIKFYHNEAVTQSYDIIMQTKYAVAGETTTTTTTNQTNLVATPYQGTVTNLGNLGNISFFK